MKKVSFHYEFFYVSLTPNLQWNTFHTDRIQKVYLNCALFYVSLKPNLDWNTFHTDRIQKVSLHCAFFYVPLDYLLQKSTFHNDRIQKVSLHCVLSCPLRVPHSKGFSPLCIHLWSFRFLDELKHLPHWSHSIGFPPFCLFRSRLKFSSWLTSHSTGLLPLSVNSRGSRFSGFSSH